MFACVKFVPITILVASLLFAAPSGATALYFGTSSTSPTLPERGIFRVDLDGTNKQVLVDGSSTVVNARHVEVDAVNSSLYYSTGGGNNERLYRVGLNGIGLTALAENVSGDFELDVSNGHLYYSAGNIFRTDLDGNNSVAIISDSGARGLALDLVNNKVYWGDDDDNRIMRGNLDGSGAEAIYQYSSNNDVATDIEVDPIGGKVYWSTGAIGNSIVRTNLDGTGFEIVVSSGAFRGFDLDVDNNWLYWGDIVSAGISRTRLDGSLTEFFLANDADVYDVALGPALTITRPPPNDMPEPSIFALMGLGLAGIGFRRKQIKAA